MGKKPAINLCKDCRYVERDLLGWKFATCKHSSCCDPITGKGESYCSIQREYGSLCGREAKNFEPKEKGCFLWK